MTHRLCPSCLHFNEAIQTVCNSCGASLQDALRSELPSLPELIMSDPEWQAPGVADKAPQSTAVPAPGAAKAAHRAAVRRNRLAAAGPRPFATFGPRDVLVMDQHAGERDHLSRLLDGFGFCAWPAVDIAGACELLSTRDFAAVFLDIVLDGSYQSPEAELCQQVKRAVPRSGGRSPALIIVADRALSVDRVRATLAGVDSFLVKPAKRGDVVRALDESGVSLPSDSRQA
jgi:CheY-like chemotaxis protein